MENKVNVSVDSGQHNRDYDEFRSLKSIIGCRCVDSEGSEHTLFCNDCRAGLCPDWFPCQLDFCDGGVYAITAS